MGDGRMEIERDKKMMPCKDCLLIPICRHKHYLPLFSDCDKINEYIYGRGGEPFVAINYQNMLTELFDILHPTKWTALDIYDKSKIFEDGRRVPWHTQK